MIMSVRQSKLYPANTRLSPETKTIIIIVDQVTFLLLITVENLKLALMKQFTVQISI